MKPSRTFQVLLLAMLTLPGSAETFKSHDGAALHYEVIGKGEPIVLLSGGPGFSPDYLRPIANTLAGKYRFILFHQRGTGKSADNTDLQLANLIGDVEALRKERDVNKLTIVAHSFGGILAMMYGRQYPDRVGGLAFIDSGGPTLKSVPKFNANLDSRFTAQDKALIKEWSARMESDRKRAVLEITIAKTPAYFADRGKARLLIDEMAEDSFSDAVFWAIVPQMMALDLRSGLEKIQAPVIVIHGRQDPLESAQEMHETFPGSQLELIDNAGHFPWLEQPERFYKVLDGFLASLFEMCPH